MADLLPWLNVLLVPMLGYVVSIERRLTRLEALREAERERHYHPATREA
jgi:hypothetical protein